MMTPVPTVSEPTRLRARPACARHRVSTHQADALDGVWEFVGLEPDAARTPDDLARRARGIVCAAFSPMEDATTIGAALLRAGEISLDAPPDLDASDWWMRHRFTSTADGTGSHSSWLVFEGLATIVDVWLNGVHLGRADDMFVAWEAEVSELLRAENELVLCARALRPLLRPQRPRARWKSRLVDSQEWRWLRTTQMGRMPGAGPRVAPVGPWRPVTLEHRQGPYVRALWIAAARAQGESLLDVEVDDRAGTATDARIARMCERSARADARRAHGYWLADDGGGPEYVARARGGHTRMASPYCTVAPWSSSMRARPDGDRDRAGRLPRALRPHRRWRVRSDGQRRAALPSRDLLRRRATGRASDCPDVELDEEMHRLRDAGVNCIRLSGCFTYGSSRSPRRLCATWDPRLAGSDVLGAGLSGR